MKSLLTWGLLCLNVTCLLAQATDSLSKENNKKVVTAITSSSLPTLAALDGAKTSAKHHLNDQEKKTHHAPVVKKVYPPKKKLVNLSFPYRYYQLYKEDKKTGFDSSRLWSGAKLKKTFNNKGSIHHDLNRNFLKWKLKGEDDNEYYNIVRIVGDNYAQTIGGIRYFRFQDPELGPSVAVYYPESNLWIIYRQNPPPKTH